MKKLFTTYFILIFILLLGISSKTMANKRTDLYNYSSSAKTNAHGGAGIASYYNSMFLLNPSVLAYIERTGGGLSYGGFQNFYHNINGYYFAPTSYWNFGFQCNYQYFDTKSNIVSFFQSAVGGSKEITPRMAIGSAFNFVYINSDVHSFNPGISLGLTYRFNGSRNSGFGFFNPLISTSGRYGFQLDSDPHNSDLGYNYITTGYAFSFFKENLWQLRFYNDFSLQDSFNLFTISAGLEYNYNKKYFLRGGAKYHIHSKLLYSSGLGYNINSENYGSSISYALVLGSNATHYISMEFKYGKPDLRPPRRIIKVDHSYISPNYDGNQDYSKFNIVVFDESKILGWRFQIKDKENKIIREYKRTHNEMIKKQTIGELISGIFTKKESLIVPEYLLWDGTDRNGFIVSDDIYTYTFSIWDERNNIAPILKGKLIVDNTKPDITVSIKEKLFSPNNDKRKDILEIDHIIKSDKDDVWNAGFKNSKGIVIKKYSATKDSFPKKIRWDGLDEQNKPASPGVYTYFIYSKDKAGNSVSKNISEIILTRKYELADVNCDKKIISYKRHKKISFYNRLSSIKDLQNWNIVITNLEDKIVKVLFGKKFKKLVEWDCLDTDNSKLKDGTYYYQLFASFKSGNIPKSFKKKIIFDSTNPEVNLDISPSSFSPNDDGKKDTVNFNITIHDLTQIQKWELNIYTEWGSLFKTMKGTRKPPKKIKWDGFGDAIIEKGEIKHKEKVESGKLYYAILSAKDSAGNSYKTRRQKIKVEIMLSVKEDTFRIRMSNIYFTNNDKKLKPDSEYTLDKILAIVSQYKNFELHIESHTDSKGREEINLKKSENRAETVKKYLISQGLPEAIIFAKGFGETMLLYPEKNKRYKKKNNRIEFVIIKKDAEIKSFKEN